MKNLILLSKQDSVANGVEKMIYFHPEDKNKLLKVINPSYIDFMKENHPLSYRLRRLTHYWFFSNMVTEHIASREEDIDNKHHLQKILGFEDTDMGLAVVVEAIRNSDGSLGYTLGDILRKGLYKEEHKKALADFICWIQTTNIIVRDLSSGNLVWHEEGKYFVLVDGIGARYLPTLRAYSRRYNLRGNRKRGAKLEDRVQRSLNK